MSSSKFLLPIHQLLYVFALLLLNGCGGGSDSASFDPRQPTSIEYKSDELEFIDTELRRLHPDLFFSKSQSLYESDLQSLKAQAPSLSDTEFRLEMAKFIAQLGDQHTYIAMPIQIMRKFPVKIWWEDDRAIVIETSEQYSQYLGQELLSIDGVPLWELKDVGMRYLPHQNDAWKDALSPRFIHLAEVLFNEGMIASPSVADFVFESIEEVQSTEEIFSKVEINDWTRIENQQDTLPLYRLSEDNYHYAIEGNLLYIQYNSARDISGYPLSSFINDLQTVLAQQSIEKIIVDLRFNYGGAIDHFIPVINFLADTDYNTEQNLFVLTGRNSFSSAVGAIYSFEDLTNASFVGGPSGGKPNGFSHVIGYRLSGSLNSLYMSTHYLAVTDSDVDSFYPQHNALFTQQDFLTGQDPAINYILQTWP